MIYKYIHIGELIKQRNEEMEIPINRMCAFLNCSEMEIREMYKSASMDTQLLLRWSKLLEYDFFRVYTQHLILYAVPAKTGYNKPSAIKSGLPEFRKNIYTREVIDFIMELIDTHQKTRQQVMEEYRIPKTTLYKWYAKYKQRD
ncbi:hypothetical protein HNP38_002138 [Chryseobacterium defluvii]|uniref:Uncharacterized protein n=1 Tax=Chryseobacterium defluvii TaxID=160396 RepID=A0A840KIY0_9FLAO|nr:transposase [Chryseobacterium defluvii]MBB4806842.1 hypothetical protein [Chryseobacterium defluvii]